MKARLYILTLLAGTLAVAGCKTDSEDDIPGWGEDEKPQTTVSNVVINEICGKQDPDDDWIEFYNKGAETEDLSGAYIIKTDEEGKDEVIYTFPKGSSIAPGGYLVVATLTGELTAGISNSKELALTLVTADGKTADKFDRDSDVGKDKSHSEGGSYARVPDGTGQWQITESCTRGTANSSETAEEAPKVVLNEVCGKQEPDDDWIELLNAGTKSMDLSGAYIIKTDEDGLDETIYTFPAGRQIAPGEHLVIATLTGELQAGISNKKKVALTLYLADGTKLDKFDRDSDVGKDASHADGGSYARIPEGTGSWTVTETATRGDVNK